MLPFFGGALAVTDREGNFEIAPTLELRFYMSRPATKLEALCFAAPSFRSDELSTLRPESTHPRGLSALRPEPARRADER